MGAVAIAIVVAMALLLGACPAGRRNGGGGGASPTIDGLMAPPQTRTDATALSWQRVAPDRYCRVIAWHSLSNLLYYNYPRGSSSGVERHLAKVEVAGSNPVSRLSFMPATERELAALIERYQESYYNGHPEVSDAEFDQLWDNLKALNSNHPLLQRVGQDEDSARKKRPHIIFMNSQSKASNSADFAKWATKVAHPQWIGQYKLDGVSVELQYQQGKLRYALTRGDGWRGDDITANVRRMPGVPQSIESSFSGGVRGEIMMLRSIHARHYPQFANCRNTAAGIVKRLDGVGSEYLQIVCYDALQPNYFTDNSHLLEWLAIQRFQVVRWRTFPHWKPILEWHREVADQRNSLDIDIDGLIVKGVAIDPVDAQRVRPEKQIAFKFSSEEQHTILRRVEWSQSGRLYTPIGVTDPVQLAGTTVQRANLVNRRLIQELNLQIGSTIAISKRGEIIPKIERCIDNRHATASIEIPTHCRECNSQLVNEEMRLYCPNRRCPQLLLYRIRRWIEVLEIKEFGEVLIEQLFRADHIRGVADLYRLKIEHIAQLERQGQRSAKNALSNLWAVRRLSLPRFVAACDIEGVGEITMHKVVSAGFRSLLAIVNASVAQLITVEGIGEKFAAQILEGLRERVAEMEEILAASEIQLELPRQSRLSGSSFCFTGTLSVPRNKAEELVLTGGGSILKNVTKNLTYLVTNDRSSQSSKLQQAQRYGTTIIDEQQFMRLLQEAQSAATAQ